MALEYFLDVLDIWYFQLRDESIITPKYLMNCFSTIAFLLIFMVMINLLMAYYMDEKL